jgi:ABC-type cobalamin transport system ATPase subunit
VINTGEQDPMAGLGHAQAVVVINLLDGLEGCCRTVVADNFFTAISLAKHLLEHDTYLIGTLRSNRAGSGSKVLQKNLRRSGVYGLQNRRYKIDHMERQKKTS